MKFTKMHGAGNDFILLDSREVNGMDLPGLAQDICDRHFGVGADGILVPAPSEVADLKMVYFNSDGSYAEMCGNGIRCLARYTRDKGLISHDSFTVETGAGIKKLTLYEDGSSQVDMGGPAFLPPVKLRGFTFHRVSMGNPHAVALLESEEEVEKLDLKEAGPGIEHDSVFPDRTNVEFAFVRNMHEVRMRIWERGAGETLASGTGSSAAAVAAIREGMAQSPVEVHLDGGIVEITWSGEGHPVYMRGPAEYICEGDFFQTV